MKLEVEKQCVLNQLMPTQKVIIEGAVLDLPYIYIYIYYVELFGHIYLYIYINLYNMYHMSNHLHIHLFFRRQLKLH